MRASEQARRFRVGQVLTDLFEESMQVWQPRPAFLRMLLLHALRGKTVCAAGDPQKYSESLSKEFMVDLESNAAALCGPFLRLP